MLLVAQQAGAGQQRHALALGDLARRVLQAERAHLRRRRPEEHDAGALARLGEVRVLAQEAVAGMDRLRAGLRRGRVEDRVLTSDNSRAAGGRTEPDGCVGLRDVRRVPIGLRVHRDRRRRPAAAASG